jgi:hypothetical protein
LKSAQANSFQDPILKIPITHTKKGLAEWLQVKALVQAPVLQKRRKYLTQNRAGGVTQVIECLPTVRPEVKPQYYQKRKTWLRACRDNL